MFISLGRWYLVYYFENIEQKRALFYTSLESRHTVNKHWILKLILWNIYIFVYLYRFIKYFYFRVKFWGKLVIIDRYVLWYELCDIILTEENKLKDNKKDIFE